MRWLLAVCVLVSPMPAHGLELQREGEFFALDMSLPNGSAFRPDGLDYRFRIANVNGSIRLVQDYYRHCGTLVDEREKNWKQRGYERIAASIDHARCVVTLRNATTEERATSFYTFKAECSCYLALHFRYNVAHVGEFLALYKPLLQATNAELLEADRAVAHRSPLESVKTGPGNALNLIALIDDAYEVDDRLELPAGWQGMSILTKAGERLCVVAMGDPDTAVAFSYRHGGSTIEAMIVELDSKRLVDSFARQRRDVRLRVQFDASPGRMMPIRGWTKYSVPLEFDAIRYQHVIESSNLMRVQSQDGSRSIAFKLNGSRAALHRLKLCTEQSKLQP